ncbi:MAG: DNA repair protein RecN [Bacteroidetes bacterium]|nr:MAG: DNA repair protein RecN [Bacteroidota bacterium]
MLSRLHIKNFGLIDQIDQSFQPGLNTITGETGAGKSMIIGALGLILGGRADAKALRDQSQKCILEAEFKVEKSLEYFFKQNDLEWESPLVIRREISLQGRSRAFINDSPVKLDLLKKLYAELIDIHTQEQTLKINFPEYQLHLLDLYANCEKDLLKYQKIFSNYQRLNAELVAFEKKIEKDKATFDYLNFQLKELTEAGFKSGEIAELEQNRELLANRDAIKQAIGKGKYILADNENNVTENLHALSTEFEKIKEVSDWLKDYYERLIQVYNEIKDISYEFDQRSEEFEMDNGELEEIEQRLSTYYRLENKYKLKGDDSLIKLRDDLALKLGGIENYDTDLIAKKESVTVELEKLILAGKKLNINRKNSAPEFENQIEKNLRLLGIAYPKVKFEFEKFEKPEETGLFRVELKFSSNPDSIIDSIETVASGGEKSRLMLVMKSILGHKLNIKSIVFDEIDSGISGEVALRTGDLLEKLAKDTQVISITHLSQVACKGANHYKVSKIVVNGKTKIRISLLDREQRINELAEMISGKEITDAARKTANELLT